MKSDLRQKNLIHNIKQLVDSEVVKNPLSYNKAKPYQSYERIGFIGKRWSVEKQISEYGLHQFFNPESYVLDIGSNFGFFTVEFALHCKLSHGIEPNPYLNRIGEITAEYLNVKDKVNFFDCRFEQFESSIKYDLALSLAAFFTQDGCERSKADDYFKKINSLLTSEGSLFYESTSYTKTVADQHYIASQQAIEAITHFFTSVKVWETPSGSPGCFRKFAIGREKR